jgi:hypothetical protein
VDWKAREFPIWPVIFTRINGADWIKSTRHLSEVLRLLNQYPSEKMNAFPVSDQIDIPGTNDATLVNPIGEKLQSEEQPTYFKRPYRMHKEKPHSDTPITPILSFKIELFLLLR